MKPKVLEVPASDVSFEQDFHQLEAAMTAKSDAELQSRQQDLQQLDQARMLTRHFRNLRRSASTPLKHFQRAVDPGRFIGVKVAGTNRIMKLDPTGWAHDEGRTLDRLVNP